MSTLHQDYCLNTALWYQHDAAYLYKQSRVSIEDDELAAAWIASRIQEAAAHSYAQARLWMKLEEPK